MGRRKHVTKAEFKQIKSFLNAGIKVSAITKVTGRSWGTITAVRDHENLKAMKEFRRNQRRKYAPFKKPVEAEVEGKPSSEIPAPEMSDENKIVAELMQIKHILTRLDTYLKTATDGKRRLTLN